MTKAPLDVSSTEGRLLSALCRMFFAVVLLFGFLASTASALDRDEAASVVDILERLADASGETVFYDDLAADEWFEFDEGDSELIAAAGFGRESWKVAYDRVLKGMIATIPQAEIDEAFGDAEERIAAIASLSGSQKREVLHEWRVKQAKIAVVRVEGKAYAAAVEPFAPRMMKIMKAF